MSTCNCRGGDTCCKNNPAPLAQYMPGCICPAGSNLTCQNQMCPRKPVQSYYLIEPPIAKLV